MEIINSHVHVYPAAIAKKASKAIGQFYDAPIKYDGTIAQLLKENKENNISRCLIHSVATTEHQVNSINNFIKTQLSRYKEFIGFMALHPSMGKEEIKDEVDRCIALGFKGVKLHPDCQLFNIDGKEAEKIYDVVEGRLPILMHMGDKRFDFSSIQRLLNVLNNHQGLKVIAAHMGGYSHWDEVGVYHEAKYGNFYFDTSSSLSFISPTHAVSIIRDFGAERFFFGSDYPMWSVSDELKKFNALALLDEEKELILGKNLKDFLKL